MLKLLRSQKTQKKIYIVLAVAVIASFGVSGLLISHDNQKTASEIGRIHGKRITVQDYLASYKAVDHQARMMYGKAYDQLRGYINMKGEAWDRLLLLSYAKEQGIKTSDDEVEDWISKQGFLQTRGQFDDRLYKMFVSQYLHTEERAFEEEIRQMLTIGKIQEKIEKSIQITDAETKTVYTDKQKALKKPFDQKEFDKNKEGLKKDAVDQKSKESMEKILADLRKELKPNTKLLKEIFPEEEKAIAPIISTTAVQKTPAVPAKKTK